ncbi:MAG: orotidine-5'-phosphate decarboxylase [Bacteroidia bacterium]|nr:orotidine-5'-phosphate decarboxylase [Bacteroidia bacterium]
MLNRKELIEQIHLKKSFLCVGLDSDKTKIPKHLLLEPDPLFSFNKAIIDATKDLCVAYKINTAFFEADGWQGWQSMQKTFDYISSDILKIADAKRGDIGNTSHQYAKAFFHTLKADALTLAPYMGNDSLAPFFQYPGHWGIVLALTSNKGSADYEQQKVGTEFLYERVIRNTCNLGSSENLMFVVGATKPHEFKIIRNHAPDHFLLVPGIGAQGGNLSEVVKYGRNKDVGLLVNASRSIIYAGNDAGFTDNARKEAKKIQLEMSAFL